jgi:photosystem II stability/assembly factor-like uncharacterized protein
LIDAFVTKLNPSGSGLVYSTYLGGTGQEEGLDIALDSAGSAYVTGRTCSPDLPLAAGYSGGFSDAFVAKLSPSGREFVYTRYIGGDGIDTGNGIAVDAAGAAYVAGQTASTNLPTTQGALQAKLAGGAFYATEDGGASWDPGSGLPNQPVNALAIDHVNPSTVYAGTGNCSVAGGVHKSTDGGATWKLTGLSGVIVQAIAVDPQNGLTVYAERYKSTDGGETWRQLTVPNAGGIVSDLVIDPVAPSTIYLGTSGATCGDVLEVPAFQKSTDGGETWRTITNAGFPFTPFRIAIDPKNPNTLYGSNGPLHKSTDGGATWSVILQAALPAVLAIDPVNTETLYVKVFSRGSEKLVKSTDGGKTFADTGLSERAINDLVIDPVNTTTLYAAVGGPGAGGVFKSTDGGAHWAATDLRGVRVTVLAINPLDPSKVYAGTLGDTDAFITKVGASGSAFAYSTYFGTRAPDAAAGIGVDEPGNAYITGRTSSDRFPTQDAIEEGSPNGPFDPVAFLTKFNASGGALVYSTYLVSDDPSFASAIAVDAAGRAYVAGTFGTFGQTASLIQAGGSRSIAATRGGFDVFAVKVASPPRITGVSITGKHLTVTGEGFDRDAAIIINGVGWSTKNDAARPATVLIAKKAAKSIAPGAPVSIQVRNSDGMTSEAIRFTR